MKKNIINQYSEKDIINANKQVYSKIARTYEDVVFTTDANSRLFLAISDCIKYLRKTKKDLLALDACGGSGQAAFIINELGCSAHLVDLSSEMIKNSMKHFKKNNIKIKTINSEINQFLKKNEIKYDLIVFSSALHHLRHPDKILISAMKNLSEGGLLLTISDPTQNIQKKSFKILSIVDRAINHFIKNPMTLFKITSNKISILFGLKKIKPLNQGWLSEFHSRYGIDDDNLISTLRENGNYVLKHKRYSAGYTYVFQKIYTILRYKTSFLMVLSNKNSENFQS
tara:strand:+ start:2426 stop:3277 length:852 start_codon:yes stop_codon:yes gene_type:complete